MSVRNFNTDKSFENINGSPHYLGTISVTSSNSISDLSGVIKKGDRLILQPDAACYVLPGNAAVTQVAPCVALTASNGLSLAAGEKFYMCLVDDASPFNLNGEGYVQAITSSGTANLRVFRLD